MIRRVPDDLKTHSPLSSGQCRDLARPLLLSISIWTISLIVRYKVRGQGPRKFGELDWGLNPTN